MTFIVFALPTMNPVPVVPTSPIVQFSKLREPDALCTLKHVEVVHNVRFLNVILL